MRQREILAPHRAGLQLPHQMRLRDFVARHHHQARGVLVQAMHDAGARHAGQLRIAMQQTVEQSAVPVAGAGMGHQPGRLVDHDPVGAVGHHGEGNGFRREGQAFRAGLGADFDPVGRSDEGAYPGRRPIDPHMAVFDPALQAAAGMLGKQRGQHLVEPVGALPGGHREKGRLARRRNIVQGLVQGFVRAHAIGVCPRFGSGPPMRVAGGYIRHGDKSYNPATSYHQGNTSRDVPPG